MRKYSVICAAALVLFLAANVFAADYSRLVPKYPVALVKIDMGSIMNNHVFSSFYSGEIKKSLDPLFNEFEKRTGLSFTRDISGFGAFAGPGVDFDAPGPNNVCFFISGKFDREKLAAEIEKEKLPAGMKFEKKGGMATVKFAQADLSGAFFNEDFAVLATGDIVEKMAAGKYEASGLDAAMKDEFENSSVYFHLKLAENLKKRLLTPELLAKVPANFKEAVQGLSAVTLSGRALEFRAAVKFVDSKTAADFKKNLESLKGMADLGIASKLREADEKLKNSRSVFEMIANDSANMKSGLTLLTEIMGLVSIVESGDTVVAGLKLPESYAAAFSPEIMPVVVAIGGITAAIAIPNFKKARQKALEKRRGRSEEKGAEYGD